MVNYYKVLGVRRNATPREVKTAYRRLARKHHPDVNSGSEKAAREFALIALAYRTLTDPQERAYYDSQLLRREEGFNSGSVFRSSNPHAQRMRRVAVQARMDKVVDNLIQAERRENFAMQQAVFTTVSLFLSTFFVALFKPRLWESFGDIGRTLLVLFFVAGLWHLVTRLRAYFKRYTYQPRLIHDSITRESDTAAKPFTRFAASSFLVVGYAASLGMGLLLGEQMNGTILAAVPGLDPHLRPELLFYPPIAVLIVDTLHTVASKID
ncbi:MAG: J domain-containing protein [Acidobacteriota bacterium]|nr:J domain-containing protein [Acidobacteriota bacterium]